MLCFCYGPQYCARKLRKDKLKEVDQFCTANQSLVCLTIKKKVKPRTNTVMEFNLNLPLTSAIAVTTSFISRTFKQELSLEEKSFTVSTRYQLWQLKKTIDIVIITVGSRVMKKKYWYTFCDYTLRNGFTVSVLKCCFWCNTAMNKNSWLI